LSTNNTFLDITFTLGASGDDVEGVVLGPVASDDSTTDDDDDDEVEAATKPVNCAQQFIFGFQFVQFSAFILYITICFIAFFY
jgi:hypothetical protein